MRNYSQLHKSAALVRKSGVSPSLLRARLTANADFETEHFEPQILCFNQRKGSISIFEFRLGFFITDGPHTVESHRGKFDQIHSRWHSVGAAQRAPAAGRRRPVARDTARQKARAGCVTTKHLVSALARRSCSARAVMRELSATAAQRCAGAHSSLAAARDLKNAA